MNNMIDIIGYFDRGNSGDEAFKDAHKHIFTGKNLRFQNKRLDSKTNEDTLGALILGGGDVVAPFFLDWIPKGRKFAMLGVGLKYEESSVNAIKEKGDDLLFTYFRNKIDVDICRSFGVTNCKYLPDIVFSLKNLFSPVHASAYIPRLRTQEKYIVVCLADHFNYSHANRSISHMESFERRRAELAKSLDVLAEDYSILFVPLSCYKNHVDNRFHLSVYELMKNQNRCNFLLRNLSPLEIIGLISRSKGIISMKLHGNIYGIVAGAPTLNIGIGRKQTLLFKENNLGELHVLDDQFNHNIICEKFYLAKTSDFTKKIYHTRDTNYNLLLNIGNEVLGHFPHPPISKVSL
jgi:polysaccharide pyruvyl transferase WcaK-like protein